MKLALNVRSFYFAIFCLSSIPHFESLASQTRENGSEIAISRHDLEAIRSICQQQLHSLDQSLSDTIQLIASKAISIDNHDENLKTLVDIRLNTNSLLQTVRNITVTTSNDLNAYLDIIEKLSLHINEILSALSNITPFEYIPHKSVRIVDEGQGEISFEYLNEMAYYNNDLVEAITKKQSTLGLSRYNRAFRKLDYFCSKHYNKFNIALKAGIVSAAALAIFYRVSPLTSVFGEAPIYGIDGKCSNDPKMGKLGTGEHYLRDVTTSPIHPIAWPILTSAAGTLYGIGSGHAKKYLSMARNYLKGGIYKQYSAESYEANRMSSDKTFDDIVGLENAKKQLREIVKFIKNPEWYARNGAIPPKGILLYGLPGTGKTHIVEALSGEIKRELADTNKNFKFFSFDASDVLTHGMKTIINVMQNEAPCVVFVDEIDMLRLQRTGNAELLANFLEGMSGISQGEMSMDLEKQVIVIAATNQIENLDKALLRPGRFGKRIAFEIPTVQERLEFLEKRLSKLFVDLSQFDLIKTARITHGCIYEHLNSAINAMVRKSKDYGIPMNQVLLDEMIDSEIRHVVFEQVKLLPIEELQVIASHHLGRALAGVLFESSFLLDKITLYPVAIDKEERCVWDRYDNGKENKEKNLIMGRVFTYPFTDNLNISTAQNQEVSAKELLAGHVAEYILSGNSSYSFSPLNNRDQAFKIALTQVCKGIDIESYSESMRNNLRDQAHELINSYEAELTELFTAHKNRMALMMHILTLSKELTADDMAILLNLDEEAAGIIIQDERRVEVLFAGVKIKAPTFINYSMLPQEEFDELYAELTKEDAQVEAITEEEILQEEPIVSELAELLE